MLNKNSGVNGYGILPFDGGRFHAKVAVSIRN